jgi:hypothetical protein
MSEFLGTEAGNRLVTAAQVDSAQLANRDREQAERKSRIIRERMSPAGALGLPRLLDERRAEYGITDGAFKFQASFDRVFIWQIPMQKGDKFEGSLIHMAESTQMRERNKAPHGVIVSAGLLALDSLRSNGLDLGHRVLFAHSAPYHIRYDVVEGQEYHLIILTAGDIIGSEDLATNLSKRVVRIKANDAAGYPQHSLINEEGKPWLPQAAWRQED